jgi:hypothetical protein
MTERRKLERFKLRVPARIEVVTRRRDVEETTPALNLVTENICSGGAFFHTSSSLPEGTEVKIDMVLKLDRIRGLEGKGPLIRVRGRVLRAEPIGMAIRFGKRYNMVPPSGSYTFGERSHGLVLS